MKRRDELKNIQVKLNEEIMNQKQQEGATNDKCGARLKAKDELQEWLEKQEDLRRNPEQDGSNIFTYRNKKARQRNQDQQQFSASQSLFTDVSAMKQWQTLSGQPTKENSVNDEFQKMSYFEKMERLKRKHRQAHIKAKVAP